MKRFLLLALFLSASTLGLVGCSEKSTDTVKENVQTPNGSVEKKTTTETTKTGDARDAR